ncbi:MAG: oxidative damage protection protein [Chloroflexi bacterium]|nr:oxidative damage protection protein [Chloroflexota bacterium]
MARMVKCAKLGRELAGLDRPPVPGPLGKRIYENISAQAWDLWKQQSVLLINHYGLSLMDPEAQKFMREQMEKFLFEDVVQVPEGWEPESATPTKGGGPAPRKK